MPSDEYIRDLENNRIFHSYGYDEGYKDGYEAGNSINKKAKWIIGTDTGFDMYECSSCECRMIKKWYDLAVGRKGYQYCPYCGSRMEKDKEDET